MTRPIGTDGIVIVHARFGTEVHRAPGAAWKINFASSGSGTSITAAEMFKMLTGVNIVPHPLQGQRPRWPISWAGRST